MLPRVADRRLWKLRGTKDGRVYSASPARRGFVSVLENGRRVLHRIAVKDLAAQYLVLDGWLVARRYPREEAEFAREAARDAAIEAARVVARTVAREKPAFKAFLAELRAELGAPVPTIALGIEMFAFRPPRGADKVAAQIARARTCGATATIAIIDRKRDLRVVAGGVGELAPLLGVDGRIAIGLESLDRDATLTFEYIAGYKIAFSLSRAPKHIDRHVRVLADALGCRPEDLAVDLRNKRVRRGGPL